MKMLNISNAFYIKLGAGGAKEEDCLLKSQTIRLGFDEVNHSACLNGDWERVRTDLRDMGKTKGKATEIANEIRHFYEADENVLWVTFFGNRLWWAFAQPGVVQLPDRSKIRKVVGKWQDTDKIGQGLSLDKINGAFLQVRRFQGTICKVKMVEYITNKINGGKLSVVSEAEAAKMALEKSLIPLIKALSPMDFELLVDLIFSNAGWRRIGKVGGSQKTIDIDLMSPVTNERAMVQIKSKSDLTEYKHYYAEFGKAKDFKMLFFVVHTPSKDLDGASDMDRSRILRAPDLSRMVIDAGLTQWVLEKNT